MKNKTEDVALKLKTNIVDFINQMFYDQPSVVREATMRMLKAECEQFEQDVENFNCGAMS